jgi:phosphatidylglycerol:prolipoprotein diacylglycerol transferase
MYILGFIAAYFVIQSGVKRRNLPINKEGVADLIFSVALGIILGGRLGYILFYNASFYLANPLKIFAVWEGGMSFHGGLLGAIIAGYIMSRKFNIGFMALADRGFLAAPIGLGLGRIGNFINGELYGRVTDLPWGIVFPGGGNLPRHPSQLYEAILEGVLNFFILCFFDAKKRPDGSIFWLFIALYGGFRSFVELFREPDQQIGYLVSGITMGQLLSLPMLVVGIIMLVRVSRENKSQSN